MLCGAKLDHVGCFEKSSEFAILPSIYTINIIDMSLNARKKARKRTKRVETDDASSGGDKNLRMQLRIPHVNGNSEGACD